MPDHDRIDTLTLDDPQSAAYLVGHLLSRHGFGFREMEGNQPPLLSWGHLHALHRGGHEGRDQDHVHEVKP